jgi:hypothetical protein
MSRPPQRLIAGIVDPEDALVTTHITSSQNFLFLLCARSRRAVETSQLRVQWTVGALSLGARRPCRKNDLSPQSMLIHIYGPFDYAVGGLDFVA